MRKAQFTLFAIVGLVLLLSVAITIGVLKNVYREKPPEENIIVDLPTELKPLGFSIEQCQERLLDEGARILLYNGGYIYPELHGIQATVPGKGNAFFLAEDYSIPYWHYVDGGVIRSKMPPLYGTGASPVSTQLADYVDERLDDCVPWDSYSQYQISKGSLKSSISFAHDFTRITTFWPLEVTTVQGVYTPNTFQARANVPVEKLYSIGEEVINFLQLGPLPEYYSLEWLGVYAAGFDQVPPLYGGTEMSYEVSLYTVSEVREILKEVFLMMTDAMTVLNSKNAHIFTSELPEIQDIYLSGTIQIPRDVSNVNIDFNYNPESDMYLSINDNIAVAKSRTIPGPPVLDFIFPRLVENDFEYDIAYPLHINFEEAGYVLNIGYEVNILNNEPAGAVELDVSGAEDYCASSGGAKLIGAANAAVSADIIYTCGSFVCDVGEMIDGNFEGYLPTCSSGVLEAVNPEYFSDVIPFSSNAGEQESVEFKFYRPEPVKLNFMQYTLIESLLKEGAVSWSDGQREEFNTYGYALSTEPMVPSNIEKKVLFSRHGRPLFAQPDENNMVELVPGVYDIFIIGVLEYPEDDLFTIPEEVMDPKGGPFGIGDPDPFTIPATELAIIPAVFLDLSDERAVLIETVPDEMTISYVGLTLYPNGDRLEPDWRYVEQLEALGAMFDLEANLTVEDTIEFD